MKPDFVAVLPHCLILAVTDVIFNVLWFSLYAHIDKTVGTETSKEVIILYFCKAVPNPQMKITENVQAVITEEAQNAG